MILFELCVGLTNVGKNSDEDLVNILITKLRIYVNNLFVGNVGGVFIFVCLFVFYIHCSCQQV